MDNTSQRFMYSSTVLVFVQTLSLVHSQAFQYGQEGGSIRLVCPLPPPDTNGRTVWNGPPYLEAYFMNENKNPSIARADRLSVIKNTTTGGYDLQITGLSRVEDVGQYSCTVNSNPPKEHEVYLDLYLSPSSISVNGSYTENGILRINGIGNSRLTLLCQSTGGVPLANVTWRRGLHFLSSGTSQASYTITASRNDDLHNYTCISNSPALSNPMMKDVQIYLKLMPQKPLIPSLSITKENQQLTVSCSSSGSRPAATLSWRFRGSSVPATTNPLPVLDTVTQTYTVSSTLALTVNRGDNGRDVTCIASNIVLSTGIQSSQTVFVHFGPDRVTFDGSTGLQENTVMNLRCTADESNNASILAWKNNSLPLSVNTQVSTSTGTYNGVITYQTYTKVLSRHDHRSVITCTATNGDIISNNSSTLDVKYSPRVNLLPSSLIAVVGQRNVILQCTLLEANPNQVSYRWNPASSTSSVFRIAEITKAHERQYECEAVNSVGSSPKARAQITVQFSPEIESFVPKTPEEVTDSISVRCNVTAKPAVNRVYWRNPKGTTVSNNAMLQINNIQRSQSGEYTCHAENTLTPTGQQPYTGTGQQTLTVNVLYGPTEGTTTTNSTNILRYVESDLAYLPSIKCHSVCNPVCNLSWNGPQTSSSAVLNLGLIKRDKNGTYICTARNVVNSSPRSASTTINIFVLYSPSIRISVSDGINTVNEGDRVQMTCTVDSQPYSNVTWYRKGERITDQDIGVTYSQLVIGSAQCYDTGNFSCHAENGIEIPATKTIPLKVKCAPRPLNGETIVHMGIPENAELNITAHFTAYPPPPIMWILKREGMNKNETIPVTNYSSTNVNESLIQSTLVINKVSQSQYGNYTAVASAEKTAMITFIVGPQRKPFPPKDVRVTCGIHDAIVIWTSNLNGGSTQNFSIKYKPLGDRNYQEYQKVILDKGKGQKINVTVNNLMQASAYIFVVIARNNFGATDSTEMANCTTGYSQALKKTPVLKSNTGGIIGGTVGGIFVIVLVVLVIAINRKYQVNCVERNPSISDKTAEVTDNGQGILSRQTENSAHYEEVEQNSREQENSYEAIKVPKNRTSGAKYEDLKPRKEENKYEEFTDPAGEKDETYTNSKMLSPANVYLNMSFNGN